MRPPWKIEPEHFEDEFWITAKSGYLERWRDWFCGLGADEQAAYEAEHSQPVVCKDMFYEIFGRPRYDRAKWIEEYRDEEGLLPPPWVFAPDIPYGSIGWRMGNGEEYWHAFFDWLRHLPPKELQRVREKYPEPAPGMVKEGLPWRGIYDRMTRGENGDGKRFFEQLDFDERRYAEWLDERYPEFWARVGGVPDFTDKRVIDFGCGRGGMVQRVMEAGASSALGIELDADYLEFAKWKVASQWDGRAEFVLGDIRELDVEPADIVVSSDTFEHVMDLPDTLAALVNACKPGGELFIGFSPLWHSPYGHHRLIGSKLPWAHLPRNNRAMLDRLKDEDGNTPDNIQQLGFNGATPADFRAALEGLPVKVISARRNVASSPLKALAMKALLIPSLVPALEKYVTIGIYWHLRRKLG